MHWRLDLHQPFLRQIHLLGNQVAVSANERRIHFYEVETGAPYPELEIMPSLLNNPVPEERREGFNQLKAPNGLFLPQVKFPDTTLLTSLDGGLRLLWGETLTLEIDELAIPLDIPPQTTIEQAALDGDLGSIAAVTDEPNLYLFQQQTRLNRVFLDDPPLVKLFITLGGAAIVLVYPHKLCLLDSVGKLRKIQDLHYHVGGAALSSDGAWLAVADADSPVIRLYNQELMLVRQQQVLDLITIARPLQMFSPLPAVAPVTALDVQGEMLAFGMAGVLCVTPIEAFAPVPQPRLLF